MSITPTNDLPADVLTDLGKVAQCFESPSEALAILVTDFQKRGVTRPWRDPRVSITFVESQLKAHERRQASGIPGRLSFLQDALAQDSGIPKTGVRDLGAIEAARYHGSWQD